MYRQVIDALEKRREEGIAELAGPVRLYLDVWRTLERASASVVPLEPPEPQDSLAERLAQGKPLCDFPALAIDWPLLGDLFSELADVLHSHGLVRASAREEAGALAHDPACLSALVHDWFSNRGLPGWRKRSPALRLDTLRFLTANAAFPFISARAACLVPLVDLRQWQQPLCPACGGRPAFAALDGESRARTLLCGRCATEWRYKRLACAFCASEDQSLLGYLSTPASHYRIFTCDGCRRYLKAIDRAHEGREPVCLVAENLLTASLDEAAARQGYRQRSS